MKKFSRILLITALVITLVLGGAGASFAASAPAGGSGIQVVYDGNYIVFKDAAPKIVNGRTMVPFRQILEDMGTVVSYDNQTKVVSAQKGNMSFSFKIGGSDITINDGTATTIRKMDVVPFVDSKTNRTYVPARFMAETLGYSVGWDNINKTVVINDFEKLFANADEDFSIMNYMISTDLDLEKTYQSTGNFDLSYLIAPGADQMAFNIAGDLDAIQYKTDADMTMHLSIEADDSISQLPPEEQASAQAMMDMLKDLNFKIKMDGSEGIMYMNSAMFSMTDPTITENTWIKMDMFKTYDEMGIDMRGLMKMSEEKTSIGDMLIAYANTIPVTNADSYVTAKASYEFLKNLIGDDAFKKQVSGSSATYTLSIGSAEVGAALAKTALTQGAAMSAADIQEMVTALDESNVDMDLVIKTKSDKLASYTLSGGADYEGGSFALDIAGTSYDTDMTFEFTMAEMLEMTMSMQVKMEETSKKVDLTLPADAKIVDYSTMVQY